MTFLLDVSVLIALIDTLHVSHDAAHLWFEREGKPHWATCPITENGLVRIISNPKYPNATETPNQALQLLTNLTHLSGHEFWPDDISVTDALHINGANLLTAGQITDTYLLALAVKRKASLATLDRRLTALAVLRGGESLHVIGSVP